MENQVPEAQPSGFQIRDVLAILQMQWRVVAVCTVAAVLLALMHGLLATRMYRSTVVLHLSTMAGQELKSDRVVDIDQYNRWNRQMFVQTQLEVIRSRTMLELVLTRYAEHGYSDLPVESGTRVMLEMLEITPRQGTELLDMSITTDDPEKAAVLVNLIAKTYQDQNLETLQESARGAKKWLGAQIAEYRERIDSSTRALVDYQGANDLADVEEQTSSLTARMDSLNQALADIITERVLLETTVWQHEKLLSEGKYEDIAKQINTPLITGLTSSFATAVTEHAQIASRYLEKTPQRKEADAKLQRIEDELKAEVERTLSAERKQLQLVRNKERNLKEEIDGGKGQMLDSQGKEEQYQKLKIDLERAKEFYVRLNQRNDELDLQSQTQLNNVRIVDEARANPRPVEPNVLLNLGLALVGGFVVGIGLGLLREYVDDTISSPLEVSTFLKVPFLGMIPKTTEAKPEKDLALHTHDNPRSNIAEALRAIRTVIELDPRGEPPQRLLVTSAVAAEGKTTTVVWLGIAFANLGKKVLIIDGDLRRPRLHKIFKVDKEPGLTGVLAGTPLDEAVLSAGVDNLFYLPSGRGGEHPNELLASTAMPQLLEHLDQIYDLVIIDSPPTVLLSDARILSRYTHAVVVLVRENTTSRVLVREAVTGLEQIGARVIGVIVNAVDLSQRRTSYKYNYGYGYGYGYGHRYDYAATEDEPKTPKTT